MIAEKASLVIAGGFNPSMGNILLSKIKGVRALFLLIVGESSESDPIDSDSENLAT